MLDQSGEELSGTNTVAYLQVPNGVNHLTELSYMGRLITLPRDIK
jgi:hypothetical protein